MKAPESPGFLLKPLKLGKLDGLGATAFISTLYPARLDRLLFGYKAFGFDSADSSVLCYMVTDINTRVAPDRNCHAFIS